MKQATVLFIGDNLVQILVNTDHPELLLIFNQLYDAFKCSSLESDGKSIANSIIATRAAYNAVKAKQEFSAMFCEQPPKMKVLVHYEDLSLQNVYCNRPGVEVVVVDMDDQGDEPVVVSTYFPPEITRSFTDIFSTENEPAGMRRTMLADVTNKLKELNF